MLDRVSTGWELAKQAFRVLRLDKELILFPVASGLACLTVLASFAIPLWNSQYLSVLAREDGVAQDPWAYVLLFLFYLANYFVIIFFNAALVACAIIRFKGGNPTPDDGLHAAMARLPQIFAWALVSATMGLLLKTIESRSEKFGQLIAGLLGMAWSVTTYFVIPVLVVERVGPFKAIQRSLTTLQRTWGQSLSANVSMGMIFLAVCLVGLIPMLPAVGLGIFGVSIGSVAVAAVGFGIAALVFLAISLVSSTLHAILLAALYLYAVEGTVPSEFDSEVFEQAFHRP